MNNFIQKKLMSANNTYKIEGLQAEFDYLHKGVKVKDGLHVSCADFKIGTDVFDIAYYVKNDGASFEVVKEVFHKKNGDVVNKVLWEKTN